ncbi:MULTISPECIES: hypothetical protein [Saccharibacillus]|uniref:hypothetical protein n=1 Tax=Saccharibacillus TaxID=456492 RepID=UPI00123A6ED3|nr:hypothetical protein [Saccharibacillus sp. WB 17]MWJ30311.1 hypothetical protein [Saccharibacillus sp. WB 17]
MFKKLFAMLIAVVLLVSGTPLISSASEQTLSDQASFDRILTDYVSITGLQEQEAEHIYNRILSYETTDDLGRIENLIYKESRNSSYEENVFYIQENYQQIINGFSKEEKELVDTYFLEHVLKYYKDNGTENDISVSEPFQEFGNPSEQSSMEPLIMDTDAFENTFVDEHEISVQQRTDTNGSARAGSIAAVRIFADPTSSVLGSSGLSIDLGTHAWITVSNTSNRTIVVGKINVAPGKTVSLGTWGNKTEHQGLWYNLESFLISKNNAYSNRVSANVFITQSNLNKLNSHILRFDKWSTLTNCSSFAASSWNLIASPSVSAGVINTPKNLASSIKNINSYSTGVTVPFNYAVYHANGSQTLTASSIYK